MFGFDLENLKISFINASNHIKCTCLMNSNLGTLEEMVRCRWRGIMIDVQLKSSEEYVKLFQQFENRTTTIATSNLPLNTEQLGADLPIFSSVNTETWRPERGSSLTFSLPSRKCCAHLLTVRYDETSDPNAVVSSSQTVFASNFQIARTLNLDHAVKIWQGNLLVWYYSS